MKKKKLLGRVECLVANVVLVIPRSDGGTRHVLVQPRAYPCRHVNNTKKKGIVILPPFPLFLFPSFSYVLPILRLRRRMDSLFLCLFEWRGGEERGRDRKGQAGKRGWTRSAGHFLPESVNPCISPIPTLAVPVYLYTCPSPTFVSFLYLFFLSFPFLSFPSPPFISGVEPSTVR